MLLVASQHGRRRASNGDLAALLMIRCVSAWTGDEGRFMCLPTCSTLCHESNKYTCACTMYVADMHSDAPA